MLILILSGLLLAVTGPVIHRIRDGLVVVLFIGFTCAAFLWMVLQIGPVSAGKTFESSLSWIPSLDVHLSFFLDGLSLLFGLLITGVGVFVLLYAIHYLRGEKYRDRFYGYIFLFMISMVGLVLAANLVTLFVFWEMTTLTSYLLIGFEHEHEASRRWALQALLVTGIGGLALLTGFLLLAQIGGSLELQSLALSADAIRQSSLYIPVLALIVFGAMTKSAQFPFHFWLPSAMVAPTPVSAYLHSAAMVKAGIYLMARLLPILGGTAAWELMLGGIGVATMVAGSLVMIVQRELKRLLAYATITVLGILFLLIGLGSASAVKAAMVYMIVHALYKGCLFMCAGAVDKGTGTREIPELGGLRHTMPWTAGVAVLGGLSMAGAPPLIGFIGKEFINKAQLHATVPWLPAVAVITLGLTVAAALVFMVDVFFGKSTPASEKAHRAPLFLILGPAPLALAGLVLGVFPDIFDDPLIQPAVTAVMATQIPIEIKPWHGFNPVLLLGIASFLLGGIVYFLRRSVPWERWLERFPPWGSENVYHRILTGVERISRSITLWLQHGNLRFYLFTVISATGILVFFALVNRGILPSFHFSDILLHEWMAAALVIVAAVAAVLARSMLTAVVALGAVGYGIAFIYLLFGAPDLAITQFGVETLGVLIFVLVLYRFPLYPVTDTVAGHVRDGILAVLAGSAVALGLQAVSVLGPGTRLSSFFLNYGIVSGKGNNVVNLILIDFRSLDTLVEITVLCVSAIGAFVLLRKKKGGER